MSSVLGVMPSKQSQFDRQLRRRHKSVNFRLRSKKLSDFFVQHQRRSNWPIIWKTLARAREGIGWKRESTGGTREIRRETESSFGAPNSSGSGRTSADGSAWATRPHRGSLTAKNCTRAANAGAPRRKAAQVGRGATEAGSDITT